MKEQRLRAYWNSRLKTISGVREDGDMKFAHKIVAGKLEGGHNCTDTDV
jgi:hypothetical protein